MATQPTLDQLKEVAGIVSASGALTLSTSHLDVPGATTTFTPPMACFITIWATFNATVNNQAHDYYINIDGTDVASETVQHVEVSNNIRTTPVLYHGSLTAASHTIKLTADKQSGSAGTVSSAKFYYRLTSA